jgi:hypothetical protein
MTFANPTERAHLIRGFHGLADYLESIPELPAPVYSTVYAFPSRGDWPGMCADIDVIAAFLRVPAGITGGGHYVAVRAFGPVEYRAVAIPPGNGRQESE